VPAGSSAARTAHTPSTRSKREVLARPSLAAGTGAHRGPRRAGRPVRRPVQTRGRHVAGRPDQSVDGKGDRGNDRSPL